MWFSTSEGSNAAVLLEQLPSSRCEVVTDFELELG